MFGISTKSESDIIFDLSEILTNVNGWLVPSKVKKTQRKHKWCISIKTFQLHTVDKRIRRKQTIIISTFEMDKSVCIIAAYYEQFADVNFFLKNVRGNLNCQPQILNFP